MSLRVQCKSLIIQGSCEVEFFFWYQIHHIPIVMFKHKHRNVSIRKFIFEAPKMKRMPLEIETVQTLLPMQTKFKPPVFHFFVLKVNFIHLQRGSQKCTSIWRQEMLPVAIRFKGSCSQSSGMLCFVITSEAWAQNFACHNQVYEVLYLVFSAQSCSNFKESLHVHIRF